MTSLILVMAIGQLPDPSTFDCYEWMQGTRDRAAFIHAMGLGSPDERRWLKETVQIADEEYLSKPYHPYLESGAIAVGITMVDIRLSEIVYGSIWEEWYGVWQPWPKGYEDWYFYIKYGRLEGHGFQHGVSDVR